MVEPVRAGLIGYGYAGRVFHAPLIAATDGIELVAVASSRPEAVHAALGSVPVEPSPEALIARDDVELVVIATPNDSHASLALKALAAGKHVVVDKPFGLSLGEAREVVAAAEAAGRQLSVFHNRRWDSDFLSVRAAIARGDVGEVVHFESHFDRFRPQVRDRWRERAGDGGGIWYDLGPHLIDQALQLFGIPLGVEASLACLRPGAVADDWAHAVLHYSDKRVILHASMLVAGGVPRFAVHGTAGSLIKLRGDAQETQLLDGMAPGAAGWGQDTDPSAIHDGETLRTVPAIPGDQRTFYRLLAQAVSTGAANPVAPVEALAVMAVLEAGSSASSERRWSMPALTEAERCAFDTIARDRAE
jgi:predicted dehydrogenase